MKVTVTRSSTVNGRRTEQTVIRELGGAYWCGVRHGIVVAAIAVIIACVVEAIR